MGKWWDPNNLYKKYIFKLFNRVHPKYQRKPLVCKSNFIPNQKLILARNVIGKGFVRKVISWIIDGEVHWNRSKCVSVNAYYYQETSLKHKSQLQKYGLILWQSSSGVWNEKQNFTNFYKCFNYLYKRLFTKQFSQIHPHFGDN